MALPLVYNLESVRARWRTTIVAILGIAGTVGVFVAMLALAAQALLVVQDMFLSGTARAFADVILPACSSVRKGWHVHGVAGTHEFKVNA